MKSLLQWLSECIVRAMPTCTIWRKNYYQPPMLMGGKRWPDGRSETYWFTGSFYYACGRLRLSDQMQMEYPKGGWTWRRLLEIMWRGG